MEKKGNLLEIASGKRNSFRSITQTDWRRDEEGGKKKEEGGEDGGRRIQPQELKIPPSFNLRIKKIIEGGGKGRGRKRERAWRSISFEEGGGGGGRGGGRREEEEEEREDDEVRTKEEINHGFMRQKREIEENQRKLREMQRARIEKGRKKEGGGNYKKKAKYSNLKIKIREDEV